MNKKDIYIFNNQTLEDLALLHPSKQKNETFQRFEFLGDRLISKVLAVWIIKNSLFSAKQMSLWINNVISAETMNKIGQFLIKNIEYTGSIEKNMVCDTLEAWIGAIFLDGGNYENIVLELWKPYLEHRYNKSPKNQLQEYCHKHHLKFVIEYEKTLLGYLCVASCLDKTSKHHDTSKKKASKKACDKLLTLLQNRK